MSAYLRLRPDLLRRRERRFVPIGDLSRCSNLLRQPRAFEQFDIASLRRHAPIVCRIYLLLKEHFSLAEPDLRATREDPADLGEFLRAGREGDGEPIGRPEREDACSVACKLHPQHIERVNNAQARMVAALLQLTKSLPPTCC